MYVHLVVTRAYLWLPKMLSTFVLFFALIHCGFSLPPSTLQNYQLPTAKNSNFNNQNRYISNKNFNRVKDGTRIQHGATGQHLYSPQKPLSLQKSMQARPFYRPQYIPTQQNNPHIPLAQKSNQIIITNRNPSPRINAQTISEPLQSNINLNKNKITNLPDFYNTLPKKKAYTIIYPNGTTEETDDLEDIKKVYPKYRLINLHEMNKITPPTEKNKEATLKGTTVNPEKVYAKNPLANPTLVPLFNKPAIKPLPIDLPKETLYTNISEDIKNKKLNHTVGAVIPQTHKNEPFAGENMAKIDLPPRQDGSTVDALVKKVENITRNIPKEPPSPKKFAKNNDQEFTNETKELNETFSKANQSDVNLSLQDNEHIPLSLLQINATNIKEIPSETIERDNFDASSEIPEIAGVNTIKNNTAVNNFVSSENSKDIDIVSDKIDTDEDETDDEKFPIPHISLLKDNDTDTPFWFDEADQNVWDMLLDKNNRTAVFFFVPSALVEKDTTVTIYPNGTRVEETTIVKKEGDKSVVSKTKVIRHSNKEESNDT